MAEHFYPHAPVRPTGRLRKQVPGSPVRCFNKRICVNADSPVTKQTGFSDRRPLKLFRLSERTLGWTSTTPRRTCRKNCVLCALYCVLCTERCALYRLLCTVHCAPCPPALCYCTVANVLCATGQRGDNEGTTKRQAREPRSRLKTKDLKSKA